MADELLDLVDKDDKVIGTVWKSAAHKDPALIHREVAVGVFNKKGEVLIQQRSMNKINGPGKWEITTAGHVGSGEVPEVAAKREVLEELGVVINPIFFEKEFAERKGKSGSTESRFFYVYYAVVEDRPKLTLDKNEVQDAKWILPSELESFAKDNYWDITGTSHKMIMRLKKHLKN